MLDEQVRRIMSSDPTVVSPSDVVNDVSKMMVEKRVQQLPVVENGKFVGIVTSYDLWKDCRKSPKSGNKKIGDVMNTRVIKISPKDKVGTAAELFMDKRFKTLPVVNLRNELKGIITAFDVIKYVLKQEYPHPSIYDAILNEK